jgi:hypothetical protein
VLQRNNIHIAVCEAGTVSETLTALRASPATTRAKAKFILATDGQSLEAEELIDGEIITCSYTDFPNHFGFFLPLAGISTIKEIKDNPIDVRATGRLNKLYVELLRENPEWAKEQRRADMNRFSVEELGIEAFDNRLIAIDEFHHVSSNPDNKLGSQLGAFIARDKVTVRRACRRRAPAWRACPARWLCWRHRYARW